MKEEVKVNKWACRCGEHVRVKGSAEGTKEEVLAWMKAHFPGLRETDGRNAELWYRNYKGGVQQYEIVGGKYSGEYLYLVEKIGAETREEASSALAEMNDTLSKAPWSASLDERMVVFLDKFRALGWEGRSVNFHDEDDGRHWQYGIVDPDSEEAMETSPLSASLGDYAAGNWSHLSGTDWSYLLQHQPRFADKCNWSKLDGSDWTQLLLRQPQFADKYTFAPTLDGGDWAYLLRHQPRFADRCDWSKLDGANWDNLLFDRPEFADRCDWSKLDGGNLSRILRRHPQFADKCDWSKLDGSDWAYLLCERVEFADRCDWDKLTARDWHILVCQRPEFADKCDMGKFTGAQIVRLFRERGRRPASGLSRRVGECDLSTLSASNWCGILALRPDLADKFEASTHDWAADEKAHTDVDVIPADEFFKDATSPEDEEAALEEV